MVTVLYCSLPIYQNGAVGDREFSSYQMFFVKILRNFFEKIQKIINAHSESSIVIGRESYLFIFLCTKTDSTMCIFCYIICDIAANILIFLIYTMVLTVYFLKFSSLFLLFHENLPKIRQKN